MPAGRPSTYKPAYCDEVINHCATGASLTSFAAEIGVARSTINKWMEDNPEFSEAVHKAKAKCAAWWERRGQQIALEGGGPGAATLVIFGLKNMGKEDWTERTLVGSDPENPMPSGFTINLRHVERGS